MSLPTPSEEDAYHALCAYTLARGDAAFVHQHVVDAYMAQHADERTPAIGVTFALVGLYLAVEEGWSGRQVQRAHMQLAREKQDWPRFALPDERGSLTAVDVLRAAEGDARDLAIHAWCRSVWAACAGQRAQLAELLGHHRIL